MRTINATLLTNQPTLSGKPCLSLIVGTAPDTVDLSSYVIGYTYEETDREAGLTLYLDNKTGIFNTLTGDLAPVTHGAAIAFARGLTVAGTDYTAELPRCWIETLSYTHEGGQQLFTIEGIDWLGKLARWRAATIQSWSSTSVTTILEWILTQVGLTRLAGTMTALSIDFDIRLHETGEAALRRLVRKIPEYLLPGLDAEIKWREIDGDDASVYTFGWNANHELLNVEAGESAWAVNSITVLGRGAYTGSATDATQITAVGTRKLTLYDYTLKSNAQCAQRAQAELDLYEAEAIEAVIICRPCHGLELYDVVTISSPPWGGSNVVGRVIRWVEQRDIDGRWHQVITLGNAPTKDPGKQPAKKSSSRRRSTRSSSTYSSILRRLRAIEDFIRWLTELLFGQEFSIGFTPIGGIIIWPGAIVDIPVGWAICDGTEVNGITTPDLRNRFLVGAGDTYTPADTGGADEVDLSHVHDPGSLNTDSDSHTHDVTGYTGYESSHTHGAGSYATGAAQGAGVIVPLGGATGVTIPTHTHDVSGTSGTGSSHRHDSGTYATDNDSHDHDVDSGTTDTAGSATHDNRPQYYALTFIIRVA